jgi:hypothetical protein
MFYPGYIIIIIIIIRNLRIVLSPKDYEDSTQCGRRICRLAYSSNTSTLKTEAAHSSETSINVYQTLRLHASQITAVSTYDLTSPQNRGRPEIASATSSTAASSFACGRVSRSGVLHCACVAIFIISVSTSLPCSQGSVNTVISRRSV